VARSLHVRLDDSSAAALEIVRAGGLSDSEAVRTALREAAARRRTRAAIRAEVLELAAEEYDREEMAPRGRRRIRVRTALQMSSFFGAKSAPGSARVALG
jgi:hypothetical protein